MFIKVNKMDQDIIEEDEIQHKKEVIILGIY